MVEPLWRTEVQNLVGHSLVQSRRIRNLPIRIRYDRRCGSQHVDFAGLYGEGDAGTTIWMKAVLIVTELVPLGFIRNRLRSKWHFARRYKCDRFQSPPMQPDMESGGDRIVPPDPSLGLNRTWTMSRRTTSMRYELVYVCHETQPYPIDIRMGQTRFQLTRTAPDRRLRADLNGRIGSSGAIIPMLGEARPGAFPFINDSTPD